MQSPTWIAPDLPPEAVPDPKPADVIARSIRVARDRNMLLSRLQAGQSWGRLKADARISRNEKCPCGSGKKFKLCHLNGPPREEYQPPARKPAPVSIPGATITPQGAPTT